MHQTCSRLGVTITEFLSLADVVQTFHMAAEAELNRRKQREAKQAQPSTGGLP